MYKTILIEDEYHSRQRLSSLLGKIPEIELLDQAENGFQGLELFEKWKPDLIFLDIQMPGMSGFEFIQQIHPIPFVVFTTAFDHFALQAFDTMAIDYLLKPLTLEQLQKAIQKMKTIESVTHKLQPILSPSQHQGHPLAHYLTRFSVKQGTCWSVIPQRDVIRIYSEESYSYLITSDKLEHIVNHSLQDLESKLDPGEFIRVHRSNIVAISKVKKIKSLGSSRFQISMQDGTEIESSRSYCKNIRTNLIE